MIENVEVNQNFFFCLGQYLEYIRLKDNRFLFFEIGFSV